MPLIPGTGKHHDGKEGKHGKHVGKDKLGDAHDDKHKDKKSHKHESKSFEDVQGDTLAALDGLDVGCLMSVLCFHATNIKCYARSVVYSALGRLSPVGLAAGCVAAVVGRTITLHAMCSTCAGILTWHTTCTCGSCQCNLSLISILSLLQSGAAAHAQVRLMSCAKG